jgi:hypothetical protein
MMTMTDLLDRPSSADPDPDAAPGGSPAAEPARSPRPRPRQRSAAGARVGPEHWWLAALLAGAGAIHLAMAPSHFSESAVEGATFLAAAWVQLALAGAVLLRPVRGVLAAVAASGLVFVGAWVMSRTSGLPYGAHPGHAETVSIVDSVCVVLEAVAVLLAVALLARIATGLVRAPVVALLGAVVAVAFASTAVASPSARDHAAHSHGELSAAGAAGAAGHAHSHGVPGANGTDDLGFSALQNGHQHAHGQDAPLTPRETVTLAKQLAVTADLVAKYPTIADAEAAGWHRAGPFSPGLGTHYMGPGFSPVLGDKMTPANLAGPMLVFDGLGPKAKLAGFMYLAYGGGEPKGFAGPNDHWHFHEKVCIKMGPNGIDTPFGADLPGVTEKMCTDVGGTFMANTGYMVHVWNVPGYESPDGMFTELNPKITCPDGTYYRIPLEDLGTKDTVCRNP